VSETSAKSWVLKAGLDDVVLLRSLLLQKFWWWWCWNAIINVDVNAVVQIWN